jgi:hypothetical protein
MKRGQQSQVENRRGTGQNRERQLKTLQVRIGGEEGECRWDQWEGQVGGNVEPQDGLM